MYLYSNRNKKHAECMAYGITVWHLCTFPQGHKTWTGSASPPTEQPASWGLSRRNATVSMPVVWPNHLLNLVVYICYSIYWKQIFLQVLIKICLHDKKSSVVLPKRQLSGPRKCWLPLTATALVDELLDLAWPVPRMVYVLMETSFLFPRYCKFRTTKRFPRTL